MKIVKQIKQIAYAKGQHDMTCKLLAIDPKVDSADNTLYEEVCSLIQTIKLMDEYMMRNSIDKAYNLSMYHLHAQRILEKTKFR